jgi:energy-converting hydrogenase A subunit R
MRDSNRALGRVLFNTDCEGPTVANDHALDVAAHWLPDGRRLFQQLSRFDDFVAYVQKRSFYNAGDTLRLILPFLKGVAQLTDKKLAKWTREKQEIQWIDGAKAAIKRLLDSPDVEVFEISASYYPFAALVAEKLGIKPNRVYSTYFSLDRYDMTPPEASRLKELATEIVMLPNVPETVLKGRIRNFSEFSKSEQAVLSRLDEIVWGEMAEELPCSSRMLREIRAMGGLEKVNAIRDTLDRTQLPASQTIYVGDSITDVEAFRSLDKMGGVSVSFNGNKHAVHAASFCSWGKSSLVTAVLVGIFRHHGKEGLAKFAESGGRDDNLVPAELAVVFAKIRNTEGGFAKLSEKNERDILERSDYYRNATRAAAVAALS